LPALRPLCASIGVRSLPPANSAGVLYEFMKLKLEVTRTACAPRPFVRVYSPISTSWKRGLLAVMRTRSPRMISPPGAMSMRPMSWARCGKRRVRTPRPACRVA